MNEDLHNIDDLFKKALDENSELPSPGVWENIDKSLDKKKVVSISKKYNILKWAAAVLLLISFGMAMYTLHIRKQNKELVKQNNEGKYLRNQQQPSTNAYIDSSVFLNKNSTVNNKKENAKPVIAEENKTDSISKNTKANDVAENKNLLNNLNLGTPINTSPGSSQTVNQNKTGNAYSFKNIKKPILKSNTGLNMQYVTVASDSNNLPVQSIASSKISAEKNTSSIDVVQQNLEKNIDVSKEKNIDVTSQIPALYNELSILKNDDISFLKPMQNNVEVTQKVKNKIAKTSIIKNNHQPLLTATLFYSPDIVSTEVRNDHPHFREEESGEIEKDEKIKLSSTFGILVDYGIGRNWKVESGITFSSRTTNIQPKTIYARPDDDGNINYRYNCSAGYSYVDVKAGTTPVSGDSVRALYSVNTLRYMSVPFALKYMITFRKFSVQPGVGVALNFLTKGKINTTIASATGDKIPSSDNIQGLKSSYLNGAASIGFQYKISKLMALSFEPAYRFALSTINKNASVKTNLNSIGLSTGLVFKF